MPRPYIERGQRTHRTPSLRMTLLVLLILLFLSARTLSSYAIEVQWWKELGQFRTWLSMLYYGLAPVVGATLLAFLALWLTHAGALRFAGARLSEYVWYRRISMLVLLLVAYVIAASSIDTWTVVRFAGSRGLPAAATAWHDAVFGKPLSFYLFDLPFYNLLRGYVLGLVIVCILLYWIAARAWQLRFRLPELRQHPKPMLTDPIIETNSKKTPLEKRWLRCYRSAVIGCSMVLRYFK